MTLRSSHFTVTHHNLPNNILQIWNAWPKTTVLDAYQTAARGPEDGVVVVDGRPVGHGSVKYPGQEAQIRSRDVTLTLAHSLRSDSEGEMSERHYCMITRKKPCLRGGWEEI